MPWYNKEAPLPTDQQPVAGLQYLDGDLMVHHYRQEWMRGQKYPIIHLPSDMTRELIPQDVDIQVHLFGNIRLPYRSTRDQAVRTILDAAHDQGLAVVPDRDDAVVVSDGRARRGYRLTFDNQRRELVGIVRFPQYAMELLDGETRAALPKLYANEALGLDAIAPVKFFTPDSNWTWWPTEFDGDDLLFGLVSGFEVELGYFRLSELESVRGPLNLPIERDLYYSPKSLAELKAGK